MLNIDMNAVMARQLADGDVSRREHKIVDCLQQLRNYERDLENVDNPDYVPIMGDRGENRMSRAQIEDAIAGVRSVIDKHQKHRNTVTKA